MARAPGPRLLHVGLAILLEGAERWKSAEQVLRRVLAIDPASTDAMTVLISAIPGLIWSLRKSPGAAMLRCTALYALIPALLVGMSRHRAAVEPVLIIAAAGFLSRVGRPKGVSKLAAASIMIAWAALGFLWLLAGHELLVIAGGIWD